MEKHDFSQNKFDYYFRAIFVFILHITALYVKQVLFNGAGMKENFLCSFRKNGSDMKWKECP